MGQMRLLWDAPSHAAILKVYDHMIKPHCELTSAALRSLLLHFKFGMMMVKALNYKVQFHQIRRL